MNEASPAGADDAQAVLDFWFGRPGSEGFGRERKIWFSKDDGFDLSVAQGFGNTIEKALRGELDRWAEAASSALARVLSARSAHAQRVSRPAACFRRRCPGTRRGHVNGRLASG